jgi:phosphoribosyl 1,2-cyclic phosphate phosphodiesterase
VIFTHEHKDHVAGLDDVRAFNYVLNNHIDVYAEKRVQVALRREFAYVFAMNKYPGIPQINMHLIKNKAFEIENVHIIPIRAYHHKLPVFGFRFGNFAYLTDVKTIPDKEKKKLTNLDILVLTTLRKEEHLSHMNLDEALKMVDELKPRMAYLNHLSHRFGLHAKEELLLPDNVRIAYDGLTLLADADS